MEMTPPHPAGLPTEGTSPHCGLRALCSARLRKGQGPNGDGNQTALLRPQPGTKGKVRERRKALRLLADPRGQVGKLRPGEDGLVSTLSYPCFPQTLPFKAE